MRMQPKRNTCRPIRQRRRPTAHLGRRRRLPRGRKTVRPPTTACTLARENRPSAQFPLCKKYTVCYVHTWRLAPTLWLDVKWRHARFGLVFDFSKRAWQNALPSTHARSKEEPTETNARHFPQSKLTATIMNPVRCINFWNFLKNE